MKTKLLLLLAVFMTAFSVNAQINSVALVGTAVGGWPPFTGNDPNQLTQVDADNWKIEGITIAAGPCKLRANNAWGGSGFEWAGAFPTAVGTSAGDIIVTIAGVYTVTLNTATGVYNFDSGAPLPVVKLVGTAVTDGTATMSPTSPTTFSLSNVTLLDGLAQFDVDGVFAGGTGFPTGTFVDNTQFIPVVAGSYTSVIVNTETGEYTFTAAPVYPSIALVGAGAGGWPNDPQVDANVLTTTDGITYKGSKIVLTAGDIKFRSNNNWTDPNWGGTSFPSGPDATNPTGNIVVTTPGTYDVVFDRTTGAYTFSFPTIAIVGAGAGGWPNDPQVDANVLTTTDGANYSIINVALIADQIKFRSNNDWSQENWGGVTFPSGPGADLNGNIVVDVAGNYDATFNRVTKAYAFTPNLATTSFAKSNFKVYPNPSNTNWNFTSAKDAITSIQVVDMLGKVVATSTSTTVDASALTTGVYFAKVATATATETIKVVKN
ncbi:T9SS type A sorting domain-containing protein [Flavobacterium sp.]|jgi:hypothetical protein|uniref:T9SS type A sorting domain-containing protein n=1 Tax=Flavobacterium sp. TaxID=239 RepID=UPI0037C0EBD2